MENEIYIVGDMFNRGLGQGKLLTLSEIYEVVEAGAFTAQVCIIGQGVTLPEVERLTEFVQSKYPEITIHIPDYFRQREDKKFVHKRQEHNVLISAPLPTAINHYQNYLCLGYSNLIKDHTTGLHMQAMVLAEAARQTPMAVIERYIYQDGERRDYKMLLSSLACAYHQYILPIEIEIITKVKKYKRRNNSIHLEFDIEFHQHDQKGASFHIEAACMPGKSVEKIEKRGMRQFISLLGSRPGLEPQCVA